LQIDNTHTLTGTEYKSPSISAILKVPLMKISL